MPLVRGVAKKKRRAKFNPIAFVTQAARKAWMWSAVKKAATKDFCEECHCRYITEYQLMCTAQLKS